MTQRFGDPIAVSVRDLKFQLQIDPGLCSSGVMILRPQVIDSYGTMSGDLGNVSIIILGAPHCSWSNDGSVTMIALPRPKNRDVD
jgi:hypothetical protein